MYSPAWWEWGDEKVKQRFIAPLAAYSKKSKEGSFLIAPGVWRRTTKAAAETVVFPFYWSLRRDKVIARGASGLWWDIAWPQENKRLRLAPAFVRWDSPKETLLIAGPVSWSVGKGAHTGAWSFHVPPFFSVWSYHPGHIKWRAMMYGIGYEREGDSRQYMALGVKTKPG
jgi:hypothetical protein